MRTKTILAAVAATLVAAVGVTAPALGSSNAGKDKTTVVTPAGVGSQSICC